MWEGSTWRVPGLSPRFLRKDSRVSRTSIDNICSKWCLLRSRACIHVGPTSNALPLQALGLIAHSGRADILRMLCDGRDVLRATAGWMKSLLLCVLVRWITKRLWWPLVTSIEGRLDLFVRYFDRKASLSAVFPFLNLTFCLKIATSRRWYSRKSFEQKDACKGVIFEVFLPVWYYCAWTWDI